MSFESAILTGPSPRRRPDVRQMVRGLPRYVAGRRAAGIGIAALASNESHHTPLPSVIGAIASAAAHVNRYPDPTNSTLAESISRHFGVTPANVAVGPGSLGVLGQLIAALCDPGDEMVYAWRSFEAYPLVAQLAGVTAREVPLRADEGHDLDAMAAAIADRTRLVLVCSPNNPTGASVSAAEFHRFMAAVPSHVLVVVDAAYGEYLDESSSSKSSTNDNSSTVLDPMAAFRSYPNVAVLRTFSKAYGLAALRVGYVIAQPLVADGVRRVALPFSVNALAQHAAVASLAAGSELRERVSAVVGERERLIAGIRESGRQIPDSDANFVWLRVTDAEREALVDRFAEAGIMVRGYPGDGVRITVADASATDRVLEVLGGHR